METDLVFKKKDKNKFAKSKFQILLNSNTKEQATMNS